MFAGIVEEAAKVLELQQQVEPYKLVIESSIDQSATHVGDSIAIEGVCLTVVESHEEQLSFELAAETVRRTTLGLLQTGDLVNLERSLALGDRLSGHFVFGHVDGTATLLKRENDGNCDRLVWRFSPELRKYFVPKGSVSLSGVSLTVGEVDEDTLSVYIIPHTNDITTLSRKKIGDQVNLEIDMLARYVQSMLSHDAECALPPERMNDAARE